MSKKREELEILLDALHDWAVRYDEPYVSMCAFNQPGYRNSSCAGIGIEQPDYDDMSIYKNYDTPAAGTAEASR